jgi:hypothetical protein
LDFPKVRCSQIRFKYRRRFSLVPQPKSFKFPELHLKRLWTPNATHRRDPGRVLREAIQDAAKSRPNLALQKHLWFHKRSTKLTPSLSGVRLSYALSAWNKLAETYHPARTALLRARNAAARAARKDRDPWQMFHDVSSINSYLKRPEHTIAQFLAFHRRSPNKADRIYNLAEPLLFEAGEFKICAKYLQPSERFAQIKRTYQVNLRLAKDPTLGRNLVQFAQKTFAEKTTRLIALLSLNARGAEAKQLARKAQRVWRNKEFHRQLALALRKKPADSAE